MTWTSTQVAEDASITYRQLDHWIRQGWLTCGDPTPGCGNSRTFTDDQRNIARWMGLLVRHGVDPAIAAPLAHDLHHHGRAQLSLFTITARTPQGAIAA